jgi:hypothetical protein
MGDSEPTPGTAGHWARIIFITTLEIVALSLVVTTYCVDELFNAGPRTGKLYLTLFWLALGAVGLAYQVRAVLAAETPDEQPPPAPPGRDRMDDHRFL